MPDAYELPPDSELISHLNNHHHSSLQNRLERYKFLWRHFGPPQDFLLLGGITAFYAFQEMKLCYIDGQNLAVIFLAHAFIEKTLGVQYILAEKDNIAEGGLKKLIDTSLEDKYISQELADRLHYLRNMRNPYTHPHAGLKPRSYMARLRNKFKDNPIIKTPEDLSEQDAKEAIEIISEFINASRK